MKGKEKIYADQTFHRKTVSETAASLQAAVQANHFGVMQVHNLKDTMAKKGVELARECLIFEVCQRNRSGGRLQGAGYRPAPHRLQYVFFLVAVSPGQTTYLPMNL